MMRFRAERGVTLIELLVGLSMSAIVSLAVVVFVSDAMRSSNAESRASKASMELRSAISALSSELRMASSASPYLVGDDSAVVTCTSAVVITGTTIRFLVTEDDSTAPSGIRRFLVGYRFDSTGRRLVRGEIAAANTTTCTVPAGDPTDTTNGRTIAENVVAVDSDNNGSVNPAFAISGNTLTVSLGVSIKVNSERQVNQSQDTVVYLRRNL